MRAPNPMPIAFHRRSAPCSRTVHGGAGSSPRRAFVGPGILVPIVLAGAVACGQAARVQAQEALLSFVVSSLEDTPDANPGDGAAVDAMGRRTLRAALEESPARPRRITFNVTGVIAVASDLPPAPDRTEIDARGRVTLDSGETARSLVLQNESIASGLSLKAVALVLEGNDNVVRATTVRGAETGIEIRGDGNQVGGRTAADRNIVIGNGTGIRLAGSGNTVQGNYVGLDAGGAQAVPNGTGILVRDVTDARGPNAIGGEQGGAGNVISGNQGDGVVIQGLGSFFPGDLLVAGNLIGTDASGTQGVGNGSAGIRLSGLFGTQITGNTIAGNAAGIFLQGGGSATSLQRAVIAGNRIGTDVSGALPLPNDGEGIRIQGAVFDTTIGAGIRGSAEPNLIAYNRGDGILIRGEGGPFKPAGNTIRLNSIHDNGGHGIRILNRSIQNGVRPPRLRRVSRRRARGTAAPGALVDLYLAARDISGAGEGRTYLATARANVRGRFDAVLTGVPRRALVTATATDGRGNTSAFARNKRAR